MATNYFLKKTKKASYREILNKLKSLSYNPNVPEEYFYDLEIQLVEMVELLKRNTLVDHGLFVEENNTTYQKMREYGTMSQYKRIVL